jgi:hypothetical protein
MSNHDPYSDGEVDGRKLTAEEKEIRNQRSDIRTKNIEPGTLNKKPGMRNYFSGWTLTSLKNTISLSL